MPVALRFLEWLVILIGAVVALIDMLNAKTAKDLALDLDIKGQGNTAK